MALPRRDKGKKPEFPEKKTEKHPHGFWERMISHFEEKGAIVCICAMTILYTLSMTARYVTSMSAAWADELVGFFFVWSILLGASVGAKRGAHLGVSILHDALPPRLQTCGLFLITACCVFTCSLLAWEGLKMVHLQYAMGQKSSQIGLPMFLVGLSVPVGLSLCAFRFVQAFLKKLKNR